jgi:hypothetical protein
MEYLAENLMNLPAIIFLDISMLRKNGMLARKTRKWITK